MLAIDCALVFLASLAGGGLPSLIHLTHTRLQTAISFIAGLMLGMALIAPLGVALAFLGLGEAAEANHVLLGCALAFCAGGFLCIACSDLLPELHFHAHDRLRLSLALLAGLGVSIFVGAFEGDGHGHGRDQETNQQHQDPN
jgi:zinc transporter ZupT